MLCLCKPQNLCEVDESYWEDVLPEDWTLDDVPGSEGVIKALDALNDAIKKCPPASWIQDRKRIIYNLPKG